MKTKLLLSLLFITFLSLFVFAQKSSAKLIDTINIVRITPPPVPTPPQKPEPPAPPNIPTLTPRPTVTPVPSQTPDTTPESSPTPLVCGPDEHLDLTGTKCLRWSDPGVPDPSDPSGQVLGASTMAGTGVFEENVFAVIFIFGSLLTTFGLRRFSSAV